MEKEIIVQLHGSFEKGAQKDTETGLEFWLARNLQELLGYSRWENFAKVIEKAKTACKTAGYEATDHFLDITKMVSLGSGAERKIDDIALTRYACYLIAQNGDPSKDQIAFANEITNFNIKRDDLRTESGITKEHVRNNQEVRELLIKRNIRPEQLPPAEDVKKIERKLASEQKKLITKAEPLDKTEDKSQNNQ